MPDRIIYTTSLKCRIHDEIRQAELARLNNAGVFRKDDVLKDTRFESASEVIHWHWIRRWLSEEHGIELVPLSKYFFARNQTDRQRNVTVPRRMLGGGNGRGTVGYATFSEKNGQISRVAIAVRNELSNGLINKTRALASKAHQPERPNLPPPTS